MQTTASTRDQTGLQTGTSCFEQEHMTYFKRFSSSKLFVGRAKLPDTGSGELKTEENASKL